jgi:hypothetical protein
MGSHRLVTPVKTGVQKNKRFWTPAFAGVTAVVTFNKGIKRGRGKKGVMEDQDE